MPWNEPGDNKNPWEGNRRPPDQGPPDLDELLRKLNTRLGRLFGGKKGPGRPGSRGGAAGVFIIAGIILAIWLASGFYIIDEGERGLVLRFGNYQRTTSPGPHWHLPYPVETVEEVDMEQVRSAQHDATMLTQDENIVAIDLATQYRVKDPAKYAFNVRLPDTTLRQAMESAIREVVGRNSMDFVLYEGRAEVAAETHKLLQRTMDAYDAGIDVLAVNLQQVQPPDPVQAAFNDAVKAREDEVRFVNEALAYANQIIPQARGEAARIEQEASAYRDQTTAVAQGDTSRFTQLLQEYTKAPQVTRDRLYLDTMESVLTNSNKIMMTADDNNSLLYLPLDKLIKERAQPAPSTDLNTPPPAVASPPQSFSEADDRRRRSIRSEREVYSP